jgi:two-component system NarL family sensor kinase
MLQVPADFGRLPQEIGLTIFRIIQEGLANIHRHSGSATALLRLERDSRQVRMELRDQGRGLPRGLAASGGPPVRFGVGLLGMRERAQLLGGRLEISSSRAGTKLKLILPWTGVNE